MDKVKVGLTVLSIMIIIAPILVEVYVYKDNLEGLILPPQIQNLMNGNNNNGATSETQSELTSLPNFQMPQPVGDPQYNPTTGAFSFPFNFTNPLSAQLTVNELSAQVATEDGIPIGNVSIPQIINLAPGENAIITAVGNLDPAVVNQLTAQYQSGTLNIALNNVNIDLGGIHIHLDHVDAGSITDLQNLASSLGGN